ncbi:MAG: CARDB domain-containing protein, partial [bacterium]
YYDGTVIDTKTVTNLAPGTDKTISFTWDTSDVAEQAYTIKAMASTVANETDVTNNEKSGSEVTIKTPSPAFTLPTYVPIAVVTVIIITGAVILYMKKR